MKILATRKIDELGRIVLPVALRREWLLEPGSAVEVLREEDGSVRLSVARALCAVCHADANLTAVKDAFVCGDCITALTAD